MVALRRCCGRLDLVVVLPEIGHPLRSIAGQETVEAIEALPQGPPIERTPRPIVLVGREVPLAERHRAVPVLGENRGQHRGVLGDARVVPGVASRSFRDGSETDGVVVASGEQRCSGRRAKRGRVKVVEAEPSGSEAIEVRRVHRSTEAREVTESHIVEHDHEDVRSARRSFRIARPGGL